jgi:hypothetical protein
MHLKILCAFESGKAAADKYCLYQCYYQVYKKVQKAFEFVKRIGGAQIKGLGENGLISGHRASGAHTRQHIATAFDSPIPN